jgi:hypothetical protein
MRQVKYRRPSAYIAKHEQEKKDEEMKVMRSSASHVDRIREYKNKMKQERSKFQHGHSSAGSISTNSSIRSPRNSRDRNNIHRVNSGASSNNGVDYENDDFYNSELFENTNNNSSSSFPTRRIAFQDPSHDQDNNNIEENRVPLANTMRIIKLTREVTVSNFHDDELGLLGNLVTPTPGGVNDKDGVVEENMYLNAQIECFLINRDYLIVTAICYMGEDTLEAEAEINAEELSAISGGELKQTSNLTLLSEIAQEVVDNVEVKVDSNSDVRLVLNLLSDAVSNDNENIVDMNLFNQAMINSSKLTNNEEINAILLPGKELFSFFSRYFLVNFPPFVDKMSRVYSCGIHLPVTILVHTGHSIGNFNLLVNLAKQSSKVEYVYTLIKISNTGEDQVRRLLC